MGPISHQSPCPEISHSGLRSFLMLYYYVFSLITYICAVFLNGGYKSHACLSWETLTKTVTAHSEGYKIMILEWMDLVG